MIFPFKATESPQAVATIVRYVDTTNPRLRNIAMSLMMFAPLFVFVQAFPNCQGCKDRYRHRKHRCEEPCNFSDDVFTLYSCLLR